MNQKQRIANLRCNNAMEKNLEKKNNLPAKLISVSPKLLRSHHGTLATALDSHRFFRRLP